MGWLVDLAHTQVEFSIRHLGISFIRGSLRLADAEFSLDENDPENASLRARIDVATLDTRDATRDGHLKSADFFDAERFPYMEFRTTKIVRDGKDRFKVSGDLTIRDVTRPVELQGEYQGPVGDPISGKRKIGFELEGEIRQEDWGLEWNVPMDGGFMLADRVRLTIDAQAIEE